MAVSNNNKESGYQSSVVTLQYHWIDCIDCCLTLLATSVVSHIVAYNSAPIYAFLEFFSPEFCKIFFPRHRLFSHTTIVKTMDTGETGMNPVTITIIDLFKEYWLNQGSTSYLLSLQLLYATHRARGFGLNNTNPEKDSSFTNP